MLRLHVCVDLMLLPCGSVMVIRYVAGMMFTPGEPLIKKWPVAPDLKAPISLLSLAAHD